MCIRKQFLALCAAVLTQTGCMTQHLGEADFLYPSSQPSEYGLIAPAYYDAIAHGYVAQNVTIPQADGNPTGGLLFTRADAIATVLYFGGNQYYLQDGKEMARRLFAEAESQHKALQIFPATGHNDIALQTNFAPAYRQFLQQAL